MDECVHDGLFAGHPPTGVTYGTDAYAAWLESARYCGRCGNDVKVRDL